MIHSALGNPALYESKGVPKRTAEEALAIFKANLVPNDPNKEAKEGKNNFVFRIDQGDKLYIPGLNEDGTVVTVTSPGYVILTILARDISGAAPSDFDPTLLQPIEPEVASNFLKPSVAATYLLCSVGNWHPQGFDRAHIVLHDKDNFSPGYEAESEYSKRAKEQTHGGKNFQVLVLGNAIWDSVDYSKTKTE